MQPSDTFCLSFICVYVHQFGQLQHQKQQQQTHPRAHASNQYLEILPYGERQVKPIGSKIVLRCLPKVDEISLISVIEWIDPDNKVIESKRLAVLPLDSLSNNMMYTEKNPDGSMSLFFQGLTENHNGNYICRARYANTNLLTKSVEIETIVAITWEDAPKEQYPILGEDYAIRCKVRARPAPTVDWLYNGDVIRTNDHYVIETHALKIKNVKDTDDGQYTCRASVPETGQLEERVIRVEVHIKPTIYESPDPLVEVIEGETANIVCKGQGKPPPKFSWVKSLHKVDLSTANRFGVNPDTGALTISNVRQEDTDEYQCMATNLAGMATTNIQVRVIVRPKIMEFQNTTVAQGARAKLACKAYGRPAPSVTFRKHTSNKRYATGAQPEDDRIVLINNVDEHRGETIGELTIDQTLRSNDGMYECIASNKGGDAFKSGHLTVEFPPSFASMSNRTIWSWDQRPVNLSCIAESIPNATIRWTYYGDRDVKDDPNIEIFGNGPISSLYIRPLDRRYFTQYKCIARNTHGERQHFIEVREAPRPAPIPQVLNKETTATTLTFDIETPTAFPDLPIRTIITQYKQVTEPSWDTARNRTWAVGPRDGYVVENLEPATTYEFRFAASNDAGRGNWDTHRRFTTTARNVPGIVSFLSDSRNVVSHFHDKYNLKYRAPPDNGERIDYYLIKWCEADKHLDSDIEVRENTCREKQESKRETWIRDLMPNTYYKIEVRAHNLLGAGPSSDMIVKTTRGNMSNASVLQHQGSIISSAAIIGIVITVLIIIMLCTDAILCCTNKSGIIYYMYERSRRKPMDEEDAKLGRDEKEPLKDEKITPIIDNGNGTLRQQQLQQQHESSVTFDGKRSISKTGFVGKDSAV
ncbi:hypothetical protein QAD02_023564 [Eretmocerus hayati]|uniref:Uncharacterized protein n=1 Tax=Eretmocerus hayati TaxID=131215 RepID=A0ACC2PWH1_9HYME|nr:hypothetical protein QAD02_023564 [Eretmocerus hayati]